jgi:hypothetical protein
MAISFVPGERYEAAEVRACGGARNRGTNRRDRRYGPTRPPIFPRIIGPPPLNRSERGGFLFGRRLPPVPPHRNLTPLWPSIHYAGTTTGAGGENVSFDKPLRSRRSATCQTSLQRRRLGHLPAGAWPSVSRFDAARAGVKGQAALPLTEINGTIGVWLPTAR